MTDISIPTFPMPLSEVTAELLKVRLATSRAKDKPLLAIVDAAISHGSRPDKLAALVQAIWDAGPKVTPPLKALGAGLADWVATNRQMVIGNDGTAARMRLAWLRELGMSEGPPAEQDPPRGVAAIATNASAR